MKLIDAQTGKTYEVPDAEVETAKAQYGLQEPGAVTAEERSGGANLQTVGEEGIRAGAALIPGVDTGPAPQGLTELEPRQVENPLTGVYSDAARERREVNPIAAGIGNSLPAVAAGALLPGSGVVGLAATLGLDAASGYAQEAVDAELENRDIRGEDVLRNGLLNGAFSLGAMGLGAGARAALKGGRNLLERAADGARQAARVRAGAAEGAELAEAVADTSTRDELMASLSARTEEAADKAVSRLEQSGPPRVANNPNAQREALGKVLDGFEKSDPAVVDALREFEKGPSGARLEGLRQARANLADDSELGQALDGIMGRADLWGDEALGSSASLEAALKLRPPPGAPAEDFLEFASAVRKVRAGEYAGLADQLEQLAERSAEVRVASALGDSAATDVAKGVDYAKAMKDLDPAEAWRLTREGADEGMRKVEAATVSDAFQHVDDTLKEDVAMSVKRQDFVKGAEKWSEAQIAKQEEWLGKPPEAESFSLHGQTLESLGALPIEGADDVMRVQALKEHPLFSKTGRLLDKAPTQGDLASTGITLARQGDGSLYLRDGRHRLTAAQELGHEGVFGRVLDAESGRELFQGDIPLKPRKAPAGTGIVAKLDELLTDMTRSRGSNPESGFALGGFAAQAERAIQMAKTRLEGADPITRNFELDQLKRSLDSVASGIGKSTQLDQASKAFGAKRVLEVADALREGLQTSELFGRNAGLQSETNKAWKGLIDPYSRITKRLSEFLGREFGNIGAESGNIRRFNPDQIERAMGAYDQNFRKDLDGALKGIDAMMSARQQSGLSHLDQLASARAGLQRIKEGFEFADLLRVAKAKAEEPAGLQVAKRALGSGSGAVAGAVAGGIPGAIAGAGLGVAAERGMAAGLERVNLLKPGSTSELTNALRKHLGLARKEQATLLSDPAFAGTLPESLRKAAMAVGEGSDAKAVQLATEAQQAAQRDRRTTARLMVDPEAARRYARMTVDAGSAVVRFQGEHDSATQAFQGYRQMLDGFARDPETMLGLLHEEFGDISDLSPKLQREATIQATKVVAYLQQNMPGRRNVSVVYPNGTPASQMEIRQFALRFTAATDPASVHEDARRGRLQKVQVDTLQALWPREYDGLRAEVLQAIGSGKASTNTRQRASLLFGFGSGVDPALGPRTRAVVAAARAEQEAQQPAPSGGSPKASTSKATAAANTPGGMAALQLGSQMSF